MNSGQSLFLDEEQVRKHLRMEELIPAMEKALIDFSAGKVTQPVRSVITVDPPGGFYGMMPALTPEGLGQKIVTFYPPNAERGIPTHMATIFLVDPQTGAPLAVMDGRLITEMRTAAVSAAATKLLAPSMQKFSRFSAAACKRAVMLKRCDWSGSSRKCASGVRPLRTRKSLQRKSAAKQCPRKRRSAMRMSW